MADSKSTRFAWLEIKEDIKDEIDERKYKPGARIPSVAVLARKYGVSVSTIRQAVDELAWDGILEVHQGKETIVAPPKRDYDPRLSFMEQARRLGGEARTEVTNTGWTDAHRDTQHALGLRKGSKVWQATRLHYLDDVPVMVEFTEFKRALALKVMDDLGKLQSIYRTLKEDLGHEDIAFAVAAVDTTSDRSFSDMLGIPRRTTFYQIERRVLISGVPQLVSYLALRSDKFKVRLIAQDRRNGQEPEPNRA